MSIVIRMKKNERQNIEPSGVAGELIENKRKRLIFRSYHRGTKEMDLVLGSFASAHVLGFTAEELSEYDSLLCENDPDLYNWITNKEDAPEDVSVLSVFQKLMNHRLV